MTLPESNDALDAYADAALALYFPALSGEAALRVKAQFMRIAQLAAPVLAYPLNPGDEPAPVYRP
ncbi:DUF4089 domain-containing protein [Caballeronia sp. LZ065]|uniref:AtzG-like protein n=1 Tax=Caballeronia sp. LZ065 TaxID=3038571 RepID=UPI00285E4020|nr:AtzG-like protein [Caballeronia sp. LZ065]MDR5781472.1 DUF4089 domain-containing protein [Caballeronia sp. LZ065]